MVIATQTINTETFFETIDVSLATILAKVATAANTSTSELKQTVFILGTRIY